MKRPRLDVISRVSVYQGYVPQLIKLMDEAVNMVAALNEPLSSNILRENALYDYDKYRKVAWTRKRCGQPIVPGPLLQGLCPGL